MWSRSIRWSRSSKSELGRAQDFSRSVVSKVWRGSTRRGILGGGRAGPTVKRTLGAGSALAAAGLGWGHFEAGWVRLAELDCSLPRVPEELAGLRIAHLSDFHLGMPSRGSHAVERAVEWVIERRPDLTLISGDLLS